MRFVDTLYDAIVATEAKTLSELNADKFKIIKMWSSMDPVAKANFKKLMGIILGFDNKDKGEKLKEEAKEEQKEELKEEQKEENDTEKNDE